MTTLSIILQAPPQGGTFQLIILAFIVLIIFLGVKASKNVDDNNKPIEADQTNKVVNVALTGGIIGLFSSSPQRKLNEAIKRENANGWRVVQIIPADSGNLFLIIYRLLLLTITLLLFTTANGYYVIMEKKL
jgi:hypothetical protein